MMRRLLIILDPTLDEEAPVVMDLTQASQGDVLMLAPADASHHVILELVETFLTAGEVVTLN